MGRLPEGKKISRLNDDMLAWVDIWLLRALFATPTVLDKQFDTVELQKLNLALRAEHQAARGPGDVTAVSDSAGPGLAAAGLSPATRNAIGMELQYSRNGHRMIMERY